MKLIARFCVDKNGILKDDTIEFIDEYGNNTGYYIIKDKDMKLLCYSKYKLIGIFDLTDDGAAQMAKECIFTVYKQNKEFENLVNDNGEYY